MTSTADITIRLASSEDAAELARLAALDSRRSVPAGPHLVAEVAGSIRAAHSLSGAAAIADPFVPTAGLLDMLRIRARA